MRGSRASVAIVDDDCTVAEGFRLVFKALGIPVAFIAFDAASALDNIRTGATKPEIVIIDYRMPVMNGIELMGEPRKIEPGIKCVFSSGDEGVRQEALDLGGDAFFVKPVSLDDIVECVERLGSCPDLRDS